MTGDINQLRIIRNIENIHGDIIEFDPVQSDINIIRIEQFVNATTTFARDLIQNNQEISDRDMKQQTYDWILDTIGAEQIINNANEAYLAWNETEHIRNELVNYMFEVERQNEKMYELKSHTNLWYELLMRDDEQINF